MPLSSQKKRAMDLNKILAITLINLKANKSLNLIRSKTNTKKQTMHISKSLIIKFTIQATSKQRSRQRSFIQFFNKIG